MRWIPRRSKGDLLEPLPTSLLKSLAVRACHIGLRAAVFIFMALGGCLAGMADAGEAEAASVLTIIDDDDGGDCRFAGVWDSGSKTCRLTADSTFLFIIASDGVTLDGAGHILTGGGSRDPVDFANRGGGGYAVDLAGRSGVTVQNLRLSGHEYGVHLAWSHNNTITGITTSFDTAAGISLSRSTHNTITGNTAVNPGADTGICVGFGSSNNIITENSITGFDRGIYLHDGSGGNDISGNTISGHESGLTFTSASSDNRAEANSISGGDYGINVNSSSNRNVMAGNTLGANSHGIRLEASAGNVVVGNNLTGNGIQAEVSGGGAGFAGAAPEGGNYWDDFDEESEGCLDSGGDGFCDHPYFFDGGSDPLPRTQSVSWPCVTPALVARSTGAAWHSFADFRARELTVEFTIGNVGSSGAFDVELVSAACDRGCFQVGPLPQAVAGPLAASDKTGPLLIRYHVPDDVSLFRIRLDIRGKDGCGAVHRYPFEPQPF